MTASGDRDEETVSAEMSRIYSETVIEHSVNPRNMGELDNADGFARITAPCGDTMQIWLRVKFGTITDISFMTDGCGTTIASGSMVTHLARGKSVSEAQNVGPQDVLKALGGLPDDSRHCALLAARTLMAAIRDYLAMSREPWKKAYRSH